MGLKHHHCHVPDWDAHRYSMCLWLLRRQDPTTSQSNAPKVLEKAAGLCIAPCGFCHMQLFVTVISVERSHFLSISLTWRPWAHPVPLELCPEMFQTLDVEFICVHSICRDIEAQEDKGKWTCAQMQGGATCRSSQGDWGAALRKKATQLQHQNRAARHPPQVCPATISCMQ